MFMSHHILKKPGYVDFKKHVSAVVTTDRLSGMKPASVKKIQDRAEEAAFQGETTLLTRVLPCITKERRQVSTEDPAKPGETYMVDEDFDDTGLNIVGDVEFKGTYLPNSFAKQGFEEKIAKALAKEQNMKNPKPDRAYGIDVHESGRPVNMSQRTLTYELLNLVPTLHHPFFLLEGKSNKGNMTFAMLQACRGGSTLVHATRMLLQHTGQANEDDGPDQDTFVYSCTMDANSMHFWVNFALVEPIQPGQQRKTVSYHMERIASKTYFEDDGPLIMRRIAHNILEWGTRTRYDMLLKRCTQIHQFDDAWMKEAAVQSREKKFQEKRKLDGDGLSGSSQSPLSGR